MRALPVVRDLVGVEDLSALEANQPVGVVDVEEVFIELGEHGQLKRAAWALRGVIKLCARVRGVYDLKKCQKKYIKLVTLREVSCSFR